jgi:hypothetical protein
MNCIENIILYLTTGMPNVNNISVTVLLSVFIVHFGRDIYR